jgi:hypothetical protein
MSSREYGNNLSDFLNQPSGLSFADFLSLKQHLEPKERFVCFPLNGSKL